MWMLGPVGFAAPWLLLGLIALPILWLLLRAVPPAPIRRRFPGVALLLGLKDDEAETDRTPWWLLLLRMLAVGAAIVGFAGPVLNPEQRAPGSGPLLILMDGGWADARDWPRRLERAGALVEEAGRAGRPVAVARLTDAPEVPVFQTAADWEGRVAALSPSPWLPDLRDWVDRLPEGGFETWWLSDGLDHPGRAELAEALAGRGQLTVYESARPLVALRPAAFEEGKVKLSGIRLPAGAPVEVEVSARGPDPAGVERELARASLSFALGQAGATAELSLPPELRNRITRFEVAGQRQAGAVSLTDDSLKRRKVAIVATGADREGLELLSPTHYLDQALEPTAEVMHGALTDLLPASPDVVILADVARLSATETQELSDWVDKGGLLVRFAGPRMAVSDLTRVEEDPLLPVRLREGGRAVGGAMSWGEPRTLAPFAEGSPFFGLPVPADVSVREQVLAQPGPDLADRTIAALDDGTPLVTRREMGAGQIVLFHVTANAEWSNLPLSGLFVDMLERLAVSTRPEATGESDLVGQVWVPQVVLDAWGQAQDAGQVAGVDGAALAAAISGGPDAAHPPGLYASGERRVALNAVGPDTELAPAAWAAGTVIEGIEAVRSQSLKGALLTAATVLLLLDILAALILSGRMPGLRRAAAVLALALVPLAMPGVGRAAETDDPLALEATTAVVLGYVETGDAQVDAVSKAGLQGLSDVLWQRTSVEPEAPIGVDIEKDELAFFPFLYWPVTTGQRLPSATAYAKLNDYLRSGGMILFDTRDGDLSPGTSPEAQQLQRIAAGLDIPPLETVPADHVLTRTFYLLQDFPGRFQGTPVWVEAAPPDAEQAEGMPFRNLNDGVTPVVIGGNDWASSWAVDDNGMWMFPVGRGFAGERQREMAYRFGVNLVMHVLTGNYKSDQVHVPALLERLGQ